MKRTVSMSRLTNQLEKMFRALNADFFDGVLEMPVITVTPTAKAYAHYTPYDAWQTADTGRREINIASGTLDRPLELICASLLHEMAHMWNDTILNIQDCSRGGTFHNRHFKEAAEAHGLICEKTDRYGYARTYPADELIEWLLNHDELREIEMCRVNSSPAAVGVGTHAGNIGIEISTKAKGDSRRYVCPCCHTIIRATRSVNVICGDCMETMIET